MVTFLLLYGAVVKVLLWHQYFQSRARGKAIAFLVGKSASDFSKLRHETELVDSFCWLLRDKDKALSTVTREFEGFKRGLRKALGWHPTDNACDVRKEAETYVASYKAVVDELAETQNRAQHHADLVKVLEEGLENWKREAIKAQEDHARAVLLGGRIKRENEAEVSKLKRKIARLKTEKAGRA